MYAEWVPNREAKVPVKNPSRPLKNPIQSHCASAPPSFKASPRSLNPKPLALNPLSSQGKSVCRPESHYDAGGSQRLQSTPEACLHLLLYSPLRVLVKGLGFGVLGLGLLLIYLFPSNDQSRLYVLFLHSLHPKPRI